MTFRELAKFIDRMADESKDDEVQILLFSRREAFPLAVLEEIRPELPLDDALTGSHVLVPWDPDTADMIDIDADNGDRFSIDFDDDDGPEFEDPDQEDSP